MLFNVCERLCSMKRQARRRNMQAAGKGGENSSRTYEGRQFAVSSRSAVQATATLSSAIRSGQCRFLVFRSMCFCCQ